MPLVKSERRQPAGRSARRAIVCAGLAGLLLAGCAPIVDYRGYVPTSGRLESVQVGSDDRQAVAARLGTPSVTGTFDQDTWYYASHREERFMFFKPEVTERQVVAIAFNDAGLVQSVNRYGLEDGQIVNLVTRETPTRGKELTFLEQMFGNFGRFTGLGSAGTPGSPVRSGSPAPR